MTAPIVVADVLGEYGHHIGALSPSGGFVAVEGGSIVGRHGWSRLVRFLRGGRGRDWPDANAYFTVLAHRGEFWRSGGESNQVLLYGNEGLFYGQFGRPVFADTSNAVNIPGAAGNLHHLNIAVVQGKGNYIYANGESSGGIYRWYLMGPSQMTEVPIVW